jgi:DNA-binding LacI/PurR family transcriptional regulator
MGDQGYDFTTADNGRQALEMLGVEPFDLMSLDIQLGHQDVPSHRKGKQMDWSKLMAEYGGQQRIGVSLVWLCKRLRMWLDSASPFCYNSSSVCMEALTLRGSSAIHSECVMQKSVSIKDIAKAAGVSPSTVSRALHHHPRISEATAAHIHHLARKMGYTPSLVARDLVTQQTNTIGLVISCISDLFVGDLVIGVEQAARSHGYTVFFISSYRDAEREKEAVQSLHQRRTTGIIITGSQIDEGYLAMRARFPQPIVLINCPGYPHSISTDNLTGARQAVEHLVQLGHRRIAYVANRHSHQANLDRLAGYKAILAHYALSLKRELIVDSDGTLAGGQRAAQQLLALPQPPTAIFCFNDLMAIGTLCALSQAGYRVPADCSVVGFDDLELAAYCSPPLTTVRQQRIRLGQQAMHMLHQLIRGRGDVQAEIVSAELVVRKTTGPAPMPVDGREEVTQP